MNESYKPSAEETESPTEAQNDVERKRETYLQEVERRTGIINRIIAAIKGGKLSDDGMVLVQIDAEREDSLRDTQKDDGATIREHNEYARREYRRASSIPPLKEYRESYLRLAVGPVMTISGMIDGENVSLKLDAYKGRDIGMGGMNGRYPGPYHGTINGEKISEELARKIYEAYCVVADVQTEDSKKSI